jgi:predicted Fe-Mo cluster-binding NifX family protein
MRIAIAQWQGRVSPVFDVAGSLLVVDIEDGREVRREEVPLAETGELGRVGELTRLGAEVLICGAISAPLEARLCAAGVEVIAFVCGAMEHVLAGFATGELAGQAFLMPGCRGRRSQRRQERNRMPRGFGVGFGGGRGRGAGGARGRMVGPLSAGPGGECVCPTCGEKASHSAGKPCVRMACPKCGTPMTRTSQGIGHMPLGGRTREPKPTQE